MTDETICTLHLGGVKERKHREAIGSSAVGPLLLGRGKDRWGLGRRSKRKAAQLREYVLRVLVPCSGGRRKSVYPRWLRWLKAPGGQMYYWGRAPRYRGQERVARVIISYREEYFDG